ncbi:MAG TPA: NAD(P)/FAD-dependent oxidoreductase [Acidimicrobiia bacterium]|nr:NAD(P)/FAD-dependent oxidoreductase [Acidimicrobiia bacterium]
MTDLLVVGAGFAGLSCAKAAATLGLDTRVIDRKPEPGAAPHTTGILVHEVADEIDVPRPLVRKIDRVRLYSPRLRWVDLAAPGYSFYATDTPGLMRWLARETEGAGATIESGVRFRGAEVVASGWRVSERSARYLVGADGARSRVAASLGLGINERFLFGVEAEYVGLDTGEDRLHVFLDAELAPGYIAWVVPGVETVQVGLAGRRGNRPQLERFVAKIAPLFNFSNARVVGHRAGLIPVGGVVRPNSRPGALLVGDAAGQVSPMTAGGIHNAIRLGRLAGRSVASHLLDGGPDPAVILQRDLPSFAWKSRLRVAFERAGNDQLIEKVFFSTPFLALARLVFFHNRGLLTAEGWRELWAPAHDPVLA